MLRALTGWKKHLATTVEAVLIVAPESRIYLTGGATEWRLTALSDIDVVVVLPREPTFEEAVELRVRVYEEMESWAPLCTSPWSFMSLGPRV